jgi:hypothetical protein
MFTYWHWGAEAVFALVLGICCSTLDMFPNTPSPRNENFSALSLIVLLLPTEPGSFAAFHLMGSSF